MSIIQNPELLPIFYHVPKSAGTYVSTWIIMLCRRYHLNKGSHLIKGWTSNRIRRALLILDDGAQLTCFYHTPTDIYLSNPHFEIIGEENSHFDKINPEIFINYIDSKDIEIFAIAIEPVVIGWRSARETIESIRIHSLRKKLLDFTVLRDPYERSLSLYNYITSKESLHETTHNSISSSSFENYINSFELEDSWFLRNLLNIPKAVIIEPYHLTLAHDRWLKNFQIQDISKVDNLINDVFIQAYGVAQTDVEDNVAKQNIFRNSTNSKIKIKFNELNPTTQQRFLDHTYWDRKLWKRYCK